MRALIFDVHGNLPALEAVLADARAAGVGGYLLGGDYALFGGWPAETVARLKELQGAHWIRGNGERWTIKADDAPGPVPAAAAACREALGDELAVELNQLSFAYVEPGLRMVHASPVDDMHSFLPTKAADEADLIAGVTDPLLIFGHTHLPFTRAAGRGTILVNPGSVGMPFDGDHRAAYALLDDDNHVEFRRVEYDHEASAAHVLERFGEQPWTELVAGRIRKAAF